MAFSPSFICCCRRSSDYGYDDHEHDGPNPGPQDDLVAVLLGLDLGTVIGLLKILSMGEETQLHVDSAEENCTHIACLFIKVLLLRLERQVENGSLGHAMLLGGCVVQAHVAALAVDDTQAGRGRDEF